MIDQERKSGTSWQPRHAKIDCVPSAAITDVEAIDTPENDEISLTMFGSKA
jgi:hypothetical protein